MILSRYLEVEPDWLRFNYSAYGKPALGDEFNEEGLRFNLSHAGGVALYAVSLSRELGIDLELIRHDYCDERIAEQFFSPREVAALRALPAEMQPEAFFNCWTRKEAYIKARGEGLSLRLDQFAVSLAPGSRAELLDVGGEPQELMRWTLMALDPGPGYVGALAVEGSDWKLKYQNLERDIGSAGVSLP
jgi:4'-phosphopantetheinyl transferase